MSSIKNKIFEGYTFDELIKHKTDVFLFSKKIRIQEPVDKKISEDDELQSKLWNEAYRTAGYYYDKPSIKHRNTMFNQFRYNFSSLLQQTQSKDEYPEVNSRNDLLSWVCKKHNEYLEIKGADKRQNCNINVLLKSYGPNEGKIYQTFGSSLDLKL